LKGKKNEQNWFLLEIYREKLRAKIRSKIWQNIHMSLKQAYLRSNLPEKMRQISQKTNNKYGQTSVVNCRSR